MSPSCLFFVEEAQWHRQEKCNLQNRLLCTSQMPQKFATPIHDTYPPNQQNLSVKKHKVNIYISKFINQLKNKNILWIASNTIEYKQWFNGFGTQKIVTIGRLYDYVIQIFRTFVSTTRATFRISLLEENKITKNIRMQEFSNYVKIENTQDGFDIWTLSSIYLTSLYWWN